MKKFVFASVMALASVGMVASPALFAQQSSDTISIKDPAEYNAYQMATTQSDPKAKAAAMEEFLQKYPQSVVKPLVLGELLTVYQQVNDPDHTLSAASRLLDADPNNMKAIFISVYLKKGQCSQKQDAQACDDAAALARKGLAVAKPKDVTDADWKTQTDAGYPIFHSAIAVDDVISKKDVKGAIDEYKSELMLYPLEQTKSGPGLVDTLQLAQAYTKPDGKDLPMAVWLYARVWNFAPPAYKAQIEPQLEYYYKKYHGALDGLDDIKKQAADSLFPPGTYVIKPADTPADIVAHLLQTTPDLKTLNLSDKEYCLANGKPEDAERVWAVMKGQATPVPGKVITATATEIDLAVSQDAKDAGIADFLVTLKKPLDDKDIPAKDAEFGLQPAAELDGTYDSYVQVPATDKTSAAVQIKIGDAFIQPEVKKKTTAPVHHKPAAGHHGRAN